MTTANGLIDQANNDLTQAFKVASKLATGDCADQGAGTPPDGPAHVH